MKLSRGKINRIKNAKNQSRINMKKITKLGGSKSRYVKGGARKRIYTNVKKRRAFNLRTKTIKMRQKGGAAGESRDAADSPSGLPDGEGAGGAGRDAFAIGDAVETYGISKQIVLNNRFGVVVDKPGVGVGGLARVIVKLGDGTKMTFLATNLRRVAPAYVFTKVFNMDYYYNQGPRWRGGAEIGILNTDLPVSKRKTYNAPVLAWRWVGSWSRVYNYGLSIKKIENTIISEEEKKHVLKIAYDKNMYTFESNNKDDIDDLYYFIELLQGHAEPPPNPPTAPGAAPW